MKTGVIKLAHCASGPEPDDLSQKQLSSSIA